MVDSDEDDSDDGKTLMTGATGFSGMTGGATASKRAAIEARAARTLGAHRSPLASLPESDPVRLPNETDGEVVDMLSSKCQRRR
jgi:ribosomal RNA-processing protein 12